jgi:predicted short-subunit dehydrogenase-like oxidoreductase (DUF2520 family)
MAAKRPNTAIIGAGTVGSVFARALHELKFPIVSVISRTGKDALALAKAVNCRRASTQIADIDPKTELILICVNDSAIGEVAQSLAASKKLKFPKLCVIHSSGAASASILAPIRKKKAVTASLHPIQTFPASQNPAKLVSRLNGIYFGVDGDTEGLKRASELAVLFGGKPVTIPPEMRPLYHVACVFASNYLVVYLDTINRLSGTIGIGAPWTEVFGPLMTRTMENVVRESASSALTGPIVRGDFSTIRMHLEALERLSPEFIPIYTMNGIELARIAKRSGRLSPELYDELLKIFRSVISAKSSTPTKKVKR